VNSSIQNINSALAKLASGEKKFTIQQDFVSKLMDSLTGGIGNLVDADMAVESARLQSLQVKQQLGVQALSIANTQPQIILSLFR
jgi:flagellin